MEINHGNKTPFTRGLLSLDKRFGKPDRDELIVLYGYMSSGKTEFAYFVARYNVSSCFNPVCFISLELPEYQMKLRLARKKACVNKYDFQSGRYSDEQKYMMDEEFKKIDTMGGLDIISPEDKSLPNLLTIMRHKYDEGYRMFVIDNLDKILAEDREDENKRYQRITSILQDFKNENHLCILLLHHAKKPETKNPYKRAGIAGMRGSQKIMDNCTQVFEIYRDLDPEIPEIDKPTVEIIQMKDSAEGNNGSVAIYFNKGIYQENNPNERP